MREEGGRVLALLAARLGSVDLADDSVQDALVTALSKWPQEGIPHNPAGWLYTVAYHAAIDRLRRADAAHRREQTAGTDRSLVQPPGWDDATGDAIDERLRVVMLCCHPALSVESQVALTLRLVAGLTTAEIAAAYRVPEATMAQRVARAKAKVRTARIPLTMPSRAEDRLPAVLAVIYGVFNEGYLSRTDGAAAHRPDLTREALRLTENLRTLLPSDPEVGALAALQLFALARESTRFDAEGGLVLLPQQDRTLWDRAAIDRANVYLAEALGAHVPGPVQLQAVIAATHTNAPSSSETDWPLIVRCYDTLLRLEPSSVVALNRAVAVSMADGPHAGLVALDAIGDLGSYYLWHSSRAELLAQCGRVAEARAAFTTARDLAVNIAERSHLARRLAQLGAEA